MYLNGIYLKRNWRLKDVCGLKDVHDYYGMVEQTGCVYMECERGHLHASIFSDVIAWRASDFKPCGFGEAGILQVVSTLPESCPGHSLLTEDEGVILGEDDYVMTESGFTGIQLHKDCCQPATQFFLSVM